MNRFVFALIVLISVNAYSKSNFYTTVELGSSANTDYDVISTTVPLETETNYTSYKLGVGYDHDLTDHVFIGIEMSYNYYGYEEYKYTTASQLSEDIIAQALNYNAVKMEYSAYDILGKLGWRFNDRWSSFGQLGVAYEMVDASDDVIGIDLNENQWIPEIAIGGQYDLNRHVAFTASFAYLMGQVSNIDEMPDITVGWVGVKYKF